VLSGLTRQLKQRRLWEPIPQVDLVPDRRHLLRTVRYIHLNPCRDGLTKDPLTWPWSTHRGAVGCEINPWISADRLHRLFPEATKSRKRADFARWFHQYVSADPDCAVDGSAFPQSAAPCEWPSRALADLVSAATAATPWSGRRGVRRHVVVLLAREQGWVHTVDLARALGISPQMVRRWAARSDSQLIVPAALCLGDPRLCLSRDHELALVQRVRGLQIRFRSR
jgi:hypothetical protein